MTLTERQEFDALVAGWSPEKRALYERLAAGMLPEDRWLFEQEVLLLHRYRWTPRIAANPVRRLVHALLFPFFHWRLYWERHNRKMGRWAMGLMSPYLEAAGLAAQQAARANLRAQRAVQRALREMH